MKMWKLSTIFLAFCLFNLGWSASIDDKSEEGLEKVDEVKASNRGYVNIGGKNYYFSEASEDKFWNDALAACRAIGMELVNLSDPAKDKAILDYIDQNLDNQAFWWAAGMRPANSRDWSWITTGETFSYTNWMYDEPGTDYTKQGCLQTVKYWAPVVEIGWCEMDCADIKWGYICE